MARPRHFVSASYLAQLREMHAHNQWPGLSGLLHIDAILALAGKIGADSILDYGCGPGVLKRKLARRIGVPITEYDPGIVGKDAAPKPADLVVCTDVMEHIEPAQIDNVIRHIFDLSRKATFITIATRAAKKQLPDGRNAHLIIRNWVWWHARLARLPWQISVRSVDTSLLTLWLRKR